MSLPLCQAQVTHWSPAGLPLLGNQIRCLYIDPSQNELYVAGEILDSPQSFGQQSICIYDGSNWDTLGNFNDQTLCVTKFNNEVIVGGFFTAVNGIPVSGIAKYNGTSWQAFGNFNQTIWCLKVIDNELYAAGQFDTIDAIPIHGIAKWTGTQWTDVFAFPWNPGSVIEDVIKYNNEIYVVGNFNIGGIDDMAYYHNGTWQQVGQGFSGFLNWVNRLEELNGELYAGGSISLADGNVGNGIQKWNGSTWSTVGGNLQDQNNSYVDRIEILDMTVSNNELYVAGFFNFAGHIPALNFAKWTGSQWCGYGTTAEFELPCYSVAVYNDTFFVGGAVDTINNIFTDWIIKWIGGNYIDSCTSPDGIIENNSFKEFYCYPNPFIHFLSVKLNIPSSEMVSYSLYNSLGENVLQNIVALKNFEFNLDLKELQGGIYFLRVFSSGEILGNAKIVKINSQF